MAYAGENSRLLQFGDLLSLQSLYVSLSSFPLFVMFLGRKLWYLPNLMMVVLLIITVRWYALYNLWQRPSELLASSLSLRFMPWPQYYKSSWTDGLDFTALAWVLFSHSLTKRIWLQKPSLSSSAKRSCQMQSELCFSFHWNHSESF